LKKIFIAGNGSKSGSAELIERISRFIKGRAILVGTSLDREMTLPELDIDLVLSLGGDGTFLNLVGQIVQREIPIMGVNFGRLGFLTAGLAQEVDHLLESYFEGGTEIYNRSVLKIEVQRGNKLDQCYALNDVLVAAGDLTRVASLVVNVSGEPLFNFRGDGLIISTPTGSTAHSLSAGGSLVDPQVEALLLTPLGSQSMSSRPMVIRPDVNIEVGILPDGHSGEVIYDGYRFGALNLGDRVRVSRHDRSIRMVQLGDFRFLHRLADKLGWSESY
jgi:NAD+ kinase